MMTAGLPKKCGIYRISIRRHDGPTRYYIGQATHILKRWNHHLARLRRGLHYNLGLQIDFTKYGEESLFFEVVLICEPKKEILTFYEQLLVSNSDSDLLYNIRIQCVISSLGSVASAERRAKISMALTGLKRSDETKAAISRAQAWKHTPEGRAKMSAAAKGRKSTPEQRARRSIAMKLRGPLPAASYQKGAATRAIKKAALEINNAVLEKGTAWVLHG